jgi:hypothetical protein
MRTSEMPARGLHLIVFGMSRVFSPFRNFKMPGIVPRPRVLFLALALLGPLAGRGIAQVENVPVSNQVYEFLDRLGVRGVLPLYSNTMIPLSRARVAELLAEAAANREVLSGSESGYLDRFLREFSHELEPANESAVTTGLFNTLFTSDASAGDLFSDREKYLYYFTDSTASLYMEFLGSLEHRRGDGDSYGSPHATFMTYGFRARGTLKGKVGYFAQVTNGTLFGDRDFALSDPRLKANVKFNELNSPYFDFAEAYLRADLSWFNLEFGREFFRLGTGYSDRLIFSDNAPATDFLKLDARYGAVRYMFVHGAILRETVPVAGPSIAFDGLAHKYYALHRLEFSALGVLNAGFSEMVIYERPSPEYAYLNPFLFLKSAEHSLRDRDNTLLALDLELFPLRGVKLYGTMLVDDVDFSKLGTGWWGNEFGWQGGAYLARVAGAEDVDAFIEYTRLEPYVYSNRTPGNAYTNGDFTLGHRLPPNSDEWLLSVVVRPSYRWRGIIGVRRMRHGENYPDGSGGFVNVGGDILTGHRDGDSPTAPFLAGRRLERNSVEVGLRYEPVINLVITGTAEYRRSTVGTAGSAASDRFFSLKGMLEF